MGQVKILLVNILERYVGYNEAYQHMIAQGCKDLGWLNSGVKLSDDCKWECVYKSWSGSSTLYCDRAKRLIYSIDMGD